MRFQIERIKPYNEQEKPCDDAYLEERTFQYPSGYAYIKKYWFIDINTLEELLVLAKKVEYSLVVSPRVGGRVSVLPEPLIEILDGRIE